MRVSTSFQFNTATENIRKANTRLFQAQNQVMTGKRFERLSDNPMVTLSALSARSMKNQVEQLDRNLTAARDYLGHSEVALGNIADLARRGYELAIQGASSAQDGVSRESLARQVDQLLARLVDLGNTTGGQGQFIFAGQSSSTRPFSTDVNGELVFAGDNDPIFSEVRPANPMRVNLDGAATLVGELYEELQTLRSNLESGNIQALSDTSVGNLNRLQGTVNVARGDIGTRMQTVEQLRQQNERRVDDLSIRISDLEEVDLAEAITQMQLAQTAYYAALQTTAQSFQMSLMDFMR